MDALTLLQQRNSAPKLAEPAPDQQAIDQMLRAATRAPDHANLRPWRFLLIEGDARLRLGELFARALSARNPEATEADCEKARSKALRAPLVIAVAVRYSEHPKVPLIEQQLSAGCAAHALLLAAESLGYAGIWRTGANAFDAGVMRGLGLASNESLVGFLYVGTRDGRAKPLPEHDPKDFATQWPG
ncbi:MAG TPA: nitroreductase [Spongiibacteraceae bacterium]|nr:nitroreductase [Spongiibacteraceae bacterium]HCS29109.1 nitroreductase [Spongiibacteraceae bacterium]